MCFTGAKKCLFYHFFMENHSIQFTTIAINVERGIVKILFKYRYFQDLLIDIDIDIFQNHLINIDIDNDIFGIALSISILISIFFRIALSISISIFSTSPYRYRYRYRYFSKVSIYRQSIFHIDISNRANLNETNRHRSLHIPTFETLTIFHGTNFVDGVAGCGSCDKPAPNCPFMAPGHSISSYFPI